MRFLLQRTSSSSVHIAGQCVAQTTALGLTILVGIAPEDTDEDIQYLVGKALRLRIFDDAEGVMNRSLLDIRGPLLLVSQFTLMADTRRGNRPSYIRAARPEVAEPLYRRTIEALETALGYPIQTGQFGADMQVSLVNDGPVTILLDSRAR